MNSSTEPLRTTKVVAEPSPTTARPFNAAQFFAHKDRLARLCIVALLGSLICNGLAIVTVINALKSSDKVTVVDDDGNVWSGSRKPLAQARELQQHLAATATEALLLRNPRDFDESELLRACFSRAALNRAGSLKLAEAKQFEELRLQQKPLIFRIDIRQSAAGEFHALVHGEVSRAGVLNDAPFLDAIPFQLELILHRNPDLLRRKSQPLIVADFQFKYETPTN